MANETTEEAMVRPSNKREVMLERVNSLRVENLNAGRLKNGENLVDYNSRLFIQLCRSKLGVTHEQLRRLKQDDLNELAALIYEKSKTPGFVQIGILAGLPILGWLTIFYSLNYMDGLAKINYGKDAFWRNMRYFWWYRRIKKMSGKNFQPDINIPQNNF